MGSQRFGPDRVTELTGMKGTLLNNQRLGYALSQFQMN